ncbi:Retrovirus-related Pol polyprotein from transposon TNT 1-94 [Melia azedarach]|uniref:Retrovirus-related Pol polyprotein from transposon TNT 1-94 n=1 Tax=Melia azedarach TaxID=155640 RepID=A0ACC1Y5P5_MELAZ|nr:Retrovirus-related Pol polyprotein from transposon TNT 1-94 [Melia azedarach]
MAFALRSSGSRGQGKVEKLDRSHLVCTHYKKNGHEVSHCFELIGYSEWWLDQAKIDKRGVGHGRPLGRGRGNARANVVAANVRDDGSHVAARSSDSARHSSSPQIFSAEQWQAIVGLIGNTKIPDDRLNGKFDDKIWIIDTRATHHVTGYATWLFDTQEILDCPVGLPNGETIVATQEGSVRLSDKITLKHVLYVPKLSCNLISVSQLNDDIQCIVQFNSYMCAIQDQTRKLIGTGVRRDGLYYFGEANSVQHVSVNETTSTMELWHKRMGHPSEKVVKLPLLVRNSKGSLNKACEVCFRAKHPRDKFPLSDNKATIIFEKIHCDLWGSYKHSSSCGARYFLTLVDDFSCAVWVYLLVDKTEVFRMLMSFIAIIERQFFQNIKVVQSDNGTEFNCLCDYFAATGILFQTSCVGTPQQNGRVERKHKHILQVRRALRFQANLPIYFWGEGVLAATHLINRTPSPLLNNKTPYEILFGNPLSYNAIRTFGCLFFAHNQKTKGDKFASRSRKCVFLGYLFGKNGWKLFDLDTKELFVSRDVKSFEDVFPFIDMDATNIVPKNIVLENIVPIHEKVHSDFDDHIIEEIEPQQSATHTTSQKAQTNSPLPPPQSVQAHPVNEQTSTSPQDEILHLPFSSSPNTEAPMQQPINIASSQHPTSSGSLEQSDEPIEMGHGMRDKFSSVLLRDFVTHTIVAKSPSPSTPSPQHFSGTHYPIAHYINCGNFSMNYRQFLAAITSGQEPRSFKEAMKDVGWKESMQEEIQALEDNGTWTLEVLPLAKRALGSQWVYRIKYFSSGDIERLKSRLVIFGNHQEAGIDYTETFAPDKCVKHALIIYF